ncbi:hypothetical protein SAMN05216522_105186 [Rosenbergiella nectarea]|uniref:Uncharacterized protein n=1 Tax=Rosenbergiella nectarea TaxID=988801 RepID=A0A1H9I332_9GAMM|nr:DUF1315 family protein [Rosenbergiella nectarea]SEQ68948.1 hypothetical protein SAMN05216522_105186 [Rosenbergiella nectarea]
MSADLQRVLAEMTPEVYQRLVTATETGKWPDGVALTPNQKEHTLQLVLLWQARHNDNPQHMSVAKGGEMVMKSKRQLKEDFGIVDDVTRISLD